MHSIRIAASQSSTTFIKWIFPSAECTTSDLLYKEGPIAKPHHYRAESSRDRTASAVQIPYSPIYSAGRALPSPIAAPTLSAVFWSVPAVRSSPPVCRMLYSCSMAVSCWSSAKERAKGTPKKRAEVVMTQAPFPLKERTLQAVLEISLTRLEIQPRVVGGTMSRRAYNRSARVSFIGS